MSRSSIRNKRQEPLPLPLPYHGPLGAGEIAVVTGTKTDVIANLGGATVIADLFEVKPTRDTDPLTSHDAGTMPGSPITAAATGVTGSTNSQTPAVSTSSAGTGVSAARAYRRKEIFRRPAPAGTVLLAAFAKADVPNPAVAMTLQPDYARTVKLVTAGGWASTVPVNVTVTGTVHGVGGVTEVIAVPANGDAIEGVKPFEVGASVAWETPAGWTAGTIAVQAGTKFGPTLEPGFTSLGVSKEIGYAEVDTDPVPVPADVAVGTVDGANGTYAPTTTVDGAHSFEILFQVTLAQTVTDGGHSHSASQAAHSHTVTITDPTHTHVLT